MPSIIYTHMLSRISSFSGPLAKLFSKTNDVYTFVTQNTILYLDAGQTASYPGTGTTWYDLSTQVNDSTLSNVTYNAGYLLFNGSNSQGSLTSSKYNVTYSGKTVFVSAYLTADMNNSTFRAFLGSSAGSRNFNFYLNRESGNYKLHFSAGGVGGFSNNLTLTPGTWFTAAITQTTGGLVTYYYNGIAVGTDTNSFSQYLAGSTENVGRADNFWDGRLGVVAVYKYALSASEILGNHRSTLTTDGFIYTNFASTAGLSLVSTDGVTGNELYITNTTGGTGNVYRSTAINFNRSFSFEWVFECSGGSGADGFCLQWTPTNNSNGLLGGGVGLLSTAVNAITFLTFVNNSVTWYKNNVSQGGQAQAISFRQNVYYWFDYDHALSTGKVYYSTSSTKPVSAQHSYTSFTFDSSDYYIGFGAAIGGSTDNHILKSMTLTF
jgi:hypothetical protein